MDKWNIIFLVSDIFLMGVVIILLFRMRSSAARAVSSAGKETSSSGEMPSADAINDELQKVQKAAKSLDIKRAEMDLLGRELKEKHDQLESVIGKVEAVIDAMAAPTSVAGTPAMGTPADGEPTRGETLAMAREMISEGKSFDEISEKLKLYRGELELLKSLEKLSSE